MLHETNNGSNLLPTLISAERLIFTRSLVIRQHTCTIIRFSSNFRIPEILQVIHRKHLNIIIKWSYKKASDDKVTLGGPDAMTDEILSASNFFLEDSKVIFLMKLRIIVHTSLYASLSFVKAVKMFVSKNYQSKRYFNLNFVKLIV